MAANGDQIARWFNEAREVDCNPKYMIIVCDTYDHEDYPVYCDEYDFEDKFRSHDGVGMQRIMEVYDLSKSLLSQLGAKTRVFNCPPDFRRR